MPSDRRVRRFLGAIFASMVGDWLTTVAVMVGLYGVAGATGAAGYVVARVAPRLLGSLAGGAADRRDPARTLAATSAVQAAVSLLLATLLWQGRLVPVLVCVAVCQALGAAQRPAHGALIPRLVTDAELPRANALYLGAWSSSLMLGPALAGPALLLLSPSLLVVVDAVSFAACAAVALSLATDTPAAAGAAAAAPRGTRLLAAAWADPTLRMLALAYLASGLMMTAASAAFAAAAAQQLGGAGAAGWLFTAAGVGSVVGSAVALGLRPPARLPGWAALAGGAGLEWAALAAFAVLPSAAAGLLALAVCGGASSVWESWGATEAQRRAAGGRVAGTVSIAAGATYAGMIAGAVLAMVALPAAGWRWTVVLGALAGAAAVTAGMLAPSGGTADSRVGRVTPGAAALRPTR